MIIALDGPAGSGKSTVAKNLAGDLGFQYLDSGAIYRSLTLDLCLYLTGHTLSRLPSLPAQPAPGTLNAEETRFVREFADRIGGLHGEQFENRLNAATYSAHLAAIPLKLDFDRHGQVMLLDGVDISFWIRLPELTARIRYPANHGPCRDKVNAVLRAYAAGHDVIIDGRDIGTIVFPDADLKFYIDASVAIRARRRYDEQLAKGLPCDLAELEKEIAARDKSDMERALAPLRQAADAEYIDTSLMSREQVLAHLRDRVNLARTC